MELLSLQQPLNENIYDIGNPEREVRHRVDLLENHEWKNQDMLFFHQELVVKAAIFPKKCGYTLLLFQEAAVYASIFLRGNGQILFFGHLNAFMLAKISTKFWPGLWYGKHPQTMQLSLVLWIIVEGIIRFTYNHFRSWASKHRICAAHH